MTDFRATVLAIMAAAVLTILSPSVQAAPNIVMLVADDWGFSDVGAFGSEIATPNLDSLAAQGMRFANFHVAASCAPTRAMLLTGVDNHRNGVGNMPETMPGEHLGKPGYDGVLNDRVVTLATLLKNQGYHTSISGKWHLGKTPEKLPDQRGFDRSFIQADSGSDNWENRPYLFLYDKAYWFEDGRESAPPEDFYSSQLFVDKALEYIDSQRGDGKPFFAYVAFQANHIPLQAPKAYIDKYQGVYQHGWDALRQARRDRAAKLGLIAENTAMVRMASTRDWNSLSEAEKRYEQRRMEVYAGMAEAMDAQIGRLIQHLQQTGEYANTVFVFLSDNGAEASDPYDVPLAKLWLRLKYDNGLEQMGAKGGYGVLGPSWASAAAAPLSTYKFFAGEGGLRVPLIISGVPGMPAGQVVRGFTHVTDIVPTLLQLVGIAQPKDTYAGREVEPISGLSLLPVLLGQTDRAHPADQAIGYELSGNAALFKSDYKLLRNLPPLGDGQWHLYDISTDPGEVNDLRAQQPVLFRQLQADYAAWAEANGVLPMPEGYDYRKQVQRYGLTHGILPGLLGLWPLLLGALGLLLVWRRRRRRRGQTRVATQ